MSASSAEPTRVLVVVADPALQETFELVLVEAGYEPHVVATLQEALVRVEEIAFALILADLFDETSPLMLPPVHALQRGVGPIPIGLLTTQPRSKDEVRAAGFAFVVPMPFHLATFLDVIATAIDKALTGEQLRQADVVVRFFVSPDDPPTVIAIDPLTAFAADLRTQAAEARSWARQRVTWVGDVRAGTLDSRERAAATCRRAQLTQAQASAVWEEAQEVWIQVEEVRALAEEATERARVVLARAT